MPYIITKVTGKVSKTNNGTIWIDEQPIRKIKNNQIIKIECGTYSIEYIPSLKKSAWAITTEFHKNTVLVANVINDPYYAPNFNSNTVTDQKIKEIEEDLIKQNQKKAKFKKSIFWGLIGVIEAWILIGIIFTTCRNM